MATFVSYLLGLFAGILGISVTLFCFEIAAAIVLPQRKKVELPSDGIRPRVTVLVPAHDESTGILATLEDIQSQSLHGDRLLVVADNCTDDTAAVARAGGAEVIERHDTSRRGKGYALDWGVRHLSSEPPEVIIIVDADCRLAEGAIERLAVTCAMTGRPVQALYLMTAPIDSKINHQVAEFAWRVKNWLRPLGLGALKLPCQLMGTGMAFPWKVICLADLSNGDIVEDLRLGLDLAVAGHPPVFCPSARVTSQFASSLRGAGTQRRRWEQGHIHTILKAAPRLLTIAIVRRDWDLLALALDLTIPPLSLLAILVLGTLGISGLSAFFGYSLVAFTVSTVSLLAFTIAAFFAWTKCGRDVLPLGALLLIPPYLMRKIWLYCQFFSAGWTLGGTEPIAQNRTEPFIVSRNNSNLFSAVRKTLDR